MKVTFTDITLKSCGRTCSHAAWTQCLHESHCIESDSQFSEQTAHGKRSILGLFRTRDDGIVNTWLIKIMQIIIILITTIHTVTLTQMNTYPQTLLKQYKHYSVQKKIGWIPFSNNQIYTKNSLLWTRPFLTFPLLSGPAVILRYTSIWTKSVADYWHLTDVTAIHWGAK